MQHVAEDESARAQQHAGDDDADDCGDDDQQNFQRISPAQLKSVTLDHLRRRALAALGRVTNGRSWEDWKVIGAYIEAGLNEAVRTSQSNVPVGIRFNQALAYWFTCNPRFRDGIEKNERNDLMRCLENMPAIDAFLDSLDPHKRRQINHPSSVLRAWKRNLAKVEAEKAEQMAEEAALAAPKGDD
jgi:hypothetical protein